MPSMHPRRPARASDTIGSGRTRRTTIRSANAAWWTARSSFPRCWRFTDAPAGYAQWRMTAQRSASLATVRAFCIHAHSFTPAACNRCAALQRTSSVQPCFRRVANLSSAQGARTRRSRAVNAIRRTFPRTSSFRGQSVGARRWKARWSCACRSRRRLTPWGNERVRRVALGQANGRMQGAITVESVRGNLFRAATLTNVQVTDSAKRVLFSARHVRVRYAILPALRGQLVLRSATLDTAVLMLEKQPGTRWNFQSLLKPRPPRDTTLHRAGPELADIPIHHGRFLYRRPWIPDSTLSLPAREAAIAKVLSPDARRRTESVPGGYQRVLDYLDIDARISAIELATVALPLALPVDALSMLAEPYRPPAIDVR